jgi:hypothetical protein
MHLASIAISSLFVASSVAALGPPHGLASRLVKSHSSLARDIKTSLKRAASDAFAGKRIKKKRAATVTKKMCRVVPTNRLGASIESSTSPVHHPPTTSPNTTTATKTRTSSTGASQPTGTNVPTANSPWKLKVTNQGSTFFDGWDFWAFSDPTHGTVDYQDQNGAWNNKLVEINSAGNAILRVETTPTVPGNRKAIRLHSRYIFNGGLIIFDAVHMPVGCGTWPAFWSNGPDWPNKGEIDIVEGVNNGPINQVSIHTAPGCTISTDTTNAVGTLNGGPNCASYETGNMGCGMQDRKSSNGFGAPFNSAGGGVYAMKWDDSGISVYFFSRDDIPDDITNGAPLPDAWHKPVAFYPAATCNPYQFFKDNFAIINTTLCGDWAGSAGAWSGSGCAASTGASTCEQYVRQNGQALNDAYWEVKYVKFYQQS